MLGKGFTMNYLELLGRSFEKYVLDEQSIGNYSPSKLEFIGENIFDFTTYENVVMSLFTKKALEVCEAITKKKTFDYIDTEEGNLWYLIMVNMPFFDGKLEWGTSIRGAWWDYKVEFESCGIFIDGEQHTQTMKFTQDEWKLFISALIEFASGE